MNAVTQRDGLRAIVVVALSIAVTLGVFAVSGFDVPTILSGAYRGSIGSPTAIEQSIRWAIPLFLVAVGVGFSFQAGYFNVGAQGQMYVGAMTALQVSLIGGGRWAPVMVPLALLAGAVAGALWSLIPGLLRVRLGADELVTSLMLNFIAVLTLQWVATGPLQDTSGSGQASTTLPIPPEYRLSDGGGVSISILLICLVLVVGAAALSARTRTGLEIRLVGRNPHMARWVGVRSERIALLVFALAGATAGMAGGIEGLGPGGSLRAGFSPELGFMAIVVALVAGFRPVATLVAALFFGALRSATLFLPVVSDVPQSGLDMLTGFVAFSITVSIIPLRIRQRSRRTEPPPQPASEVGTSPPAKVIVRSKDG